MAAGSSSKPRSSATNVNNNRYTSRNSPWFTSDSRRFPLASASRRCAFAGCARNPVPNASIAATTPSRNCDRAREPCSIESVRQDSSQHDAGPTSGSRTSNRDSWHRLNNNRKSENNSPSKIASRSNSTYAEPTSDVESRSSRSRNPFDNSAHRYTGVPFRNSCTIDCGDLVAAPATPAVRRSRSTVCPSRWIGTCCHTCEIGNDTPADSR